MEVHPVNAYILRDICTSDKLHHLNESDRRPVKTVMELSGLLTRTYKMLQQVVIPIADLMDSEKIITEHISETINYLNIHLEG